MPDPELVLELFRLLGTGAEEARLAALAADASHPSSERAVAFSSLPEAAQEAVAYRLGHVGLVDLMEGPTRELLAASDGYPDPETSELFADRLRSTPTGPPRTYVFERLEAMRREEGVAACLWEPLLHDPALAELHDACLDAIVEDGMPSSIPFLEGLRNRASDAEPRARLQKAVLKLRSQPPRPAPAVRGRAYLSACDGAGAFVVLLVLDRPGDRADVANLCLLTRGEVRDGFVLDRERPAGVEAIVERLEDAAAGVIALPLERAAAITRWAAERHPDGLAVPDDAREALALVERVAVEPLPEVKADPSVDVERLRRALDRPAHDTWFFETADLASVDVKVPKRITPRWIATAARALATDPAFRDRLLWMARYTAHHETARENPETAALFLAAAREVEERFETAALTRLMLERSPAELPHAEHVDEEELAERTFGDSFFRESIRRDVFADVETPVGRDLARLDLTEVTDSLLEEAFEELPSERRPARPARLKVAASFAAVFADRLCDGPDETGTLESRFEKLVCAIAPGSKDRALLGRRVLSGLLAFIDGVCESCPVRCFERPEEPAEELFFSDEHPSQSEPPPKPRGRRKR